MGKQSKSKKQQRPAPLATPQFTSEAPTSAISWKRNKIREALRLPSGNVALVRRVGPEAFMEQGVMPDTLAPIVQRAIHNKKGLPPRVIEDMVSDPNKLGEMVEMMDRLLCYAVIEPHVEMPPGCITCGGLDNVTNRAVHDNPESDGGHKFEEGERNPGVLYADEVEFHDKVFVMNFSVGGTRDLERFRSDHREAMGGMDSQPGVEGETV